MNLFYQRIWKYKKIKSKMYIADRFSLSNLSHNPQWCREVVGILIFAGIFQKVAEMSLKKVVDRGYIFMFFIFIVFLLTNIFNFFKKSLKFQMFKFLSLIFVRFTKSHWKSRWFSKNFCRNFPTFRRPTTSLISIYL